MSTKEIAHIAYISMQMILTVILIPTRISSSNINKVPKSLVCDSCDVMSCKHPYKNNKIWFHVQKVRVGGLKTCWSYA